VNRLRVNLIANFTGSGWAALLQFALVPLYVRLMGIEAYALVGFYASLQAILQILDFGISPTVTRELARFSSQPDRNAEARDLVRTFETGYWVIGLLIGAVLFLLASWFSTHWLKPGTMSTDVVRHAIMIMALLSVLQWPISFYEGGLMGLQRQVLLCGVRVFVNTLGGIGTILVLWRVSPTIGAFFVCQAVVRALHVALVAWLLWRHLPSADRPPRFDFETIRRNRGFAAGMSGIMAFSLVLTNIDKIVLSKLLPLELFGYYSLAWVVANSLRLIIQPVFSAAFPRFAQIIVGNDGPSLARLYHQVSQLLSVLILPATFMVVVFSGEILLLWMRQEEVARQVAPVAVWLIVGTAINGLTNPPYIVQLAHGWTRLALVVAALSCVAYVPGVVVVVIRHGMVGAAVMWAVLNGVSVMIHGIFTHRWFLPGEGWRWTHQDIMPPLLATLLVVGIGKWVMTVLMSPGAMLSGLLLIFGFAVVASALAAPEIRSVLRNLVAREAHS
jgi:O-antigen/teichoic acid export membrane protein